MRIHEWVQVGWCPSCVWMAGELGMAVRTVKRDVEFMRDRLNLPIEYDSRKGGCGYSEPVHRFPAMRVTEAEAFALLVAHKAVAQYHGTPFERPLKMAFQKLTGQLDSEERFSFENLREALSFRPFTLIKGEQSLAFDKENHQNDN